MSKIYLAQKADIEALETPYLTCSTSGSTAVKEVAASGFTLKAGVTVNVKFTYANTAANPTLNVNGTGAKYIYCKGKYSKAGDIFQYGVYCFVYDGNYWNMAEV